MKQLETRLTLDDATKVAEHLNTHLPVDAVVVDYAIFPEAKLNAMFSNPTQGYGVQWKPHYIDENNALREGLLKDLPPALHSLKLDKAYVSAMFDLSISINRGESAEQCAELLENNRDVLLEGVTRSIADPTYGDENRKLLAKLSLNAPYEELVGDDVMQRLMESGPAALSNDELLHLLSSPAQIQHADILLGESMSDFWVDAVDNAMAQSARERGEHRLSSLDLAKKILDMAAEKIVDNPSGVSKGDDHENFSMRQSTSLKPPTKPIKERVIEAFEELVGREPLSGELRAISPDLPPLSL